MGIQTFLGPVLAGTQKNNNAVAVTSNTPSASFLSPYGTGNSYRNTGAGDCFQFVSIPAATLTGLGTLSSTAVTVVPTYSVGGVAYPIVFPAGSYIDNIDFIVTTAPTLSGTTPVATIAVQLIGAPGSTYATAQTIASIVLDKTNGLPVIGVYATGNTGSWSTSVTATNPITYTTAAATAGTITATALAMLQNTGPTDAMLQLSITGSGTTPAITGGVFGLAFNYVLRNPDGSWYPQTPPSPFTTPIPAVY
jgi:hypothetical protein